MVARLNDLSGTFARLRAEMVVSAVFCWGLAELNIDLSKVPFLPFEILGQAPEGTVFSLVFGFYVYCTAAFSIRYLNELKYSEQFEHDLNLMDDQLVKARGSLLGLNLEAATLRRVADGEADRNNQKYLTATTAAMLRAADAILEVRRFVGNVRSLVAIERVIISFWIPVVTSGFLVIIALRSDWRGLMDGLAYFGSRAASLFTGFT